MVKCPKNAPPDIENLPPPTLDDPSYPFFNFANDHADNIGRVWLYPYIDAEPSLDAWIKAFVALDQRKDQTKLVALLKSDHPLQHYAGRYLLDLLNRYQEPGVRAPQLLDKLKSDAELSRDDRLVLADLLERQRWRKTKGNRPAAYEESDTEIKWSELAGDVNDLRAQGWTIKDAVDQVAWSCGLSWAETNTLIDRCRGKRRPSNLRRKFYKGLEKEIGRPKK